MELCSIIARTEWASYCQPSLQSFYYFHNNQVNLLRPAVRLEQFNYSGIETSDLKHFYLNISEYMAAVMEKKRGTGGKFKKNSGKVKDLSGEEIEFLKKNTKYDEKEILEWHW